MEDPRRAAPMMAVRPGRWQFRLSSLLLGMAICACGLSTCFAILPRYIDGWKLVSGQVLIHLTPAAQELLFDPPAPMGPMHETKVIVLRSLAYDLATLLSVVALMVWIVLRLLSYGRHGRRHERTSRSLSPADAQGGEAATGGGPRDTSGSGISRIGASIAGGLTGAIVGGLGFALLLRTLNLLPPTALLGCAVGLISGAAMARRGLEPACVVAALMAFVADSVAAILLLGN